MSASHEVLVIGAGLTGIGIGAAATLHRACIHDALILDRHAIGASFCRWPAETWLLTPTFPSAGWGRADLNALLSFHK